MTRSRHFSKSDYYYQLLRVSPTATLKEIKAAYRLRAFELHPDRHNGSTQKAQAFQELTTAYEHVLSNHKPVGQRQQQHRTAYNVNYRKVYAPRPPPHWKHVWDHKYHQDMHYGDGFQREAMKEALKEAKKSENKYQSPLGRGFDFQERTDENDHDPTLNINPYSKRSPQGPPKIVVDYEEGGMTNAAGRAHILHQERIIQDMYDRRSERRRAFSSQQQQREDQTTPTQYQRFQQNNHQDHYHPQYNPTFVGARQVSQPLQQTPSSGNCVIL